MTDDRSAALDELFTLPAGDFVAARDALARRLKGEDRAPEAAAVKALRRPTLAAWAVNQVVRADNDAYDELVAAGQAVQKAQRKALSGVRDSGLRGAAATRRGLVEALTDRAASVLVDAGARPDSHLEDVAATFEAASADPDAAEAVGRARLSAPVRVTTDFSGTSALLAMSLGADTGEVADSDDEDPAVAEARRAAIRTLEAARTTAETSARAARTTRADAEERAEQAVQAEREAAAARSAASRAEQAAEQLASVARAAAEEAAAAAATADRDAAVAQEARAALDDLR